MQGLMMRGWVMVWGVLLVVLVACAPVGVRDEGGGGLAAKAKVGGEPARRQTGMPAIDRIAYVGADWNVYTIAADGSERVALTNDATVPERVGTGALFQVYRYPTWNVAGEVAYVRYTAEGGAESAVIFASSADGVSQRRLFETRSEFPFYLYWSPDSARLGFLSSGAGTPMALQVTGDGESDTLSEGSPMYWAWSPDGQQVLAHIDGGGAVNRESRLTFLPVGSEVGENRLRLNTAFFQAPDWSPDGDYVIYARRDRITEPGVLVLADVATNTETELATFNGGIAFDWSPTGEYIAVVRGEYQPWEIVSGVRQLVLVGELVIVDVRDRRAPVVIETGVRQATTFYWSPDGTRVAFFEPFLSEIPDFTDATYRDAAPAAWPGVSEARFLGLKVANAADGSVVDVTSFQPAVAFVNTVMPYFAQYQRSTTIWSPDGTQMVVSLLAGSERSPHIAVVDARVGVTPQILDGGFLAFWSWR